MAYDEKLADRIRQIMSRQKAVTEIKMFGGLCFTLRGNMCCGVLKGDLIVRVDPESAGRYLKEPHVRRFDFSGRPMKNILYVGPAAHGSPKFFNKWIQRAVDFTLSLKPK
jgi:TfoX/Sxy family transcriptional regulator of competence genes